MPRVTASRPSEDMSIKDRTCIAGFGLSDYYKRGQSGDKSALLLCCEAIMAACEDAGIAVEEIDGFSSYADSNSAALVAPALNIPEVRYSNLVWGGGGGGACAAVANVPIRTASAKALDLPLRLMPAPSMVSHARIIILAGRDGRRKRDRQPKLKTASKTLQLSTKSRAAPPTAMTAPSAARGLMRSL